jgi:hypothetical protein
MIYSICYENENAPSSVRDVDRYVIIRKLIGYILTWPNNLTKDVIRSRQRKVKHTPTSSNKRAVSRQLAHSWRNNGWIVANGVFCALPVVFMIGSTWPATWDSCRWELVASLPPSRVDIFKIFPVLIEQERLATGWTTERSGFESR